MGSGFEYTSQPRPQWWFVGGVLWPSGKFLWMSPASQELRHPYLTTPQLGYHRHKIAKRNIAIGIDG